MHLGPAPGASTRQLTASGTGSKPAAMVLRALAHMRRAAGGTACSGRALLAPSSAPARAAHTTPRAAAAADAPGADGAAASSSAAAGAYAAADGGAPRVCILGGGFGGLYTAVKLESLIWPRGKKPRVTLIDQGERFVFKPLLYELLNGTASAEEVAPTFAQLLAPYPVQFVQDKVASVEEGSGASSSGSSVSGGTVHLAGGASVEYDYLVVALGAESDPRGVPGVKEHARPFVTLEDAQFVDSRLSQLEAAAAAGAPRAPTAVIVGAGYAGVELASVIAERTKGKGVDVRLVTPTGDILPGAPEGQREAARAALFAAGVYIMTGVKVDKLAAAGDAGGDASGGGCTVHLQPVDPSYSSGAAELPAELVVWTAGLAPASKFVKSLPFPSSPAGAIETEATLRVSGHPSAFALGDVSFAQSGGPPGGAEAAAAAAAQSGYPATAQVAFQQADYAAWNIWASINGRPLLPFRYQHLGSMMSLGAANAAVALPFELPAPLADSIRASPLASLLSVAGVKAGQQGDVTLEGPLAQLLRRAAYLYRQPTGEQRLSVAAGWLQQAAGLAARAADELGSQQRRGA